MPLRNRVTPLGDIVAVRERGLVYGNRGCLHDRSGQIVRRQATRRWIACRLSFRGWYRTAVPQPGRFTGLFFLDDATAFAAGHRPCALCRRSDYARVLSLTGAGGADELDAQLAHERDGARPAVEPASLPDGSFVLGDGEPHLVLGGSLRRWSPGGYGPPLPAPASAELITPPTLVRVLRAGWDPLVPFLHPSAASERAAPPRQTT
ncbi:MAG TPA: hypothetical protein VFU56_08620 [Gaiellaceae bacterium]|nr:hypothetical protein [Gaiellaceae bacterium]